MELAIMVGVMVIVGVAIVSVIGYIINRANHF
jgi:hypothetical protein